MTAGRLRVLVVDDNPDIILGMQMLLDHLGHEVRSALDGATALRIATNFLPQLVLLDLGLPTMDGFEVARELRKQPAGPGMQIIAVSGWGDDRSRERSTAAGFDGHWLKPVGLKELNQYFAEANNHRSAPVALIRPRTDEL